MEEKRREDRYVQIPLCLIQKTYPDDYNYLNNIVNYGICKYAKSFEYNIKEVARQLMYAYYRNRSMIPDNIYSDMRSYIDSGDLSEDLDYQGFSGPSFYPNDSIDDLIEIFDSDKDFKDGAIFMYQISQAIEFLNIKLGNIDSTIKNYENSLAFKNGFESKYGPDSCPGIKPSLLFDFRNSKQDIDILRAYIGIKSLIGQNNYVSTHKTVILSRMMGCKSNESLMAFLKANKKADEIYKKYSGRKRMDNLLYKMMERGFIMMLSKKHESRIYISAKIKTPDELASVIIKNREQNNLRKQIAEASGKI